MKAGRTLARGFLGTPSLAAASLDSGPLLNHTSGAGQRRGRDYRAPASSGTGAASRPPRVQSSISRCAMLNLLMVSWLVFTLPATGQRAWSDPAQGADSTMVECSGGAAIHQLSSAELWGWPVTGGGPRMVDVKPVRGREGLADSFPVPWPGLFYVVTRNAVGQSCASNTVSVAPTVLTGIEAPDVAQGAIIRADLFDVQGRRVAALRGLLWHPGAMREKAIRAAVDRKLPSGVYFVRGATRGGETHLRRLVVVR